MTIFLSALGLMLIIVITGKVLAANQFAQEIKDLFSQAENISDKKFSQHQLQDLPDPVQRYFKHVLKDGQTYISYTRLKHTGQFKTGKNKAWTNIRGEQYFTAKKPGFIWKGTTSMFTAKDRYVSGKGRLVVLLLGLFKIIDGQGEKYDQGELLRWLAESLWFPTNLLPGDNLQWTPIDNQTAQLNYKNRGLVLKYEVSFNSSDEITELKTKRYMGEENLETWIGKVSDYKKINGVVVPTHIEAIYRLKEGDYRYANFKVETIEYNVPEPF